MNIGQSSEVDILQKQEPKKHNLHINKLTFQDMSISPRTYTLNELLHYWFLSDNKLRQIKNTVKI